MARFAVVVSLVLSVASQEASHLHPSDLASQSNGQHFNTAITNVGFRND
jgi:hypothetical protein